jgi:hypothetical protein
MNFLFTTGMTFAFWASSVQGNSTNNNGSINIGEWFDYIPIYNELEFIQVISTDQNTDEYIIVNDLDFQTVLLSDWIPTKDIVFKGLIEGNGKTISNINLVDYSGIFGILEGAEIRNVYLDNVDINYSTSNTYASGILAGRIQGNDNLIENVHITNSSITNTSYFTGGLIGFASPLSTTTGDAIIKNVTVIDTSVSTGYSGNTYGSGGVVGTINNFNIAFEDVEAKVNVTSNNVSNVGGIVGSARNPSTISMIDISVYESAIELNATGTTLGAGGVVGYMLGQNHTFNNIAVNDTAVSSRSSSGGMIGYANQASTSLEIDGFIMNGNTISSSLASTTLGNGGVLGTLIGYNTTISNGLVTTDVTSSAGTNAGGIVGSNNATAIINLSNIDIQSSNISIIGTGTSLGSGGAVGYLAGTGHVFTDIDTDNTTIASKSSSGGLIGYASHAGTLSISQTNITAGNISSSLNSTSRGNGGVIGSLFNYNLTLSDTSVTANVTSTTTTNAGGVVGYNNATAKLNLTDVTVNSSTIGITGTNTSLGAGGVVGLSLGFGHEFLRVRMNDINVTTQNSVGGLIGRFNGSTGISNFNNIKAKDVNISTTANSNTISSGGMIGYVQGSGTDLRFFDIYVEGIIQSTNANTGGIIGYTATGTIIRISRVVVYADILLNVPGSNTDRGSAGIVGRNRSSTFQVTDGFYTGNLKARFLTSRPYVGIIRAMNNTVTQTNVRSAEVSYWSTGTTYILITTSTLYTNMRGQSPGYLTHTTNRSTLDNTYWTSNYGSFSTSIWTYNPITHLYELND